MRARSTARILGCIVLLTWSGLAAGNATEDMAEPRELRSANPAVHVPLWVPESLALRTDKTLDMTKFDQLLARWLERRERRRATAGGAEACVEERSVEHFKANATLPELANSALDVITGRVVRTDSGFWKGVPATLLTVKIDERLKWSGSFRSTEHIRVPYPGGRIVTAAGVLCGRATRSTLISDHGDPILLFILTPPADADRSIAEPQAQHELFFQQGPTVVGAPAVLNGRDLSTLAATARRVIELQAEPSPRADEER